MSADRGAAAGPGIFKRILRLHTEDAAQHWQRFDAAAALLPAGHPDIHFFAKRLEPHLDGLRLVPGRAWPLARAEAEDFPEEPGPAFVLMWLALVLGEEGGVEEAARCAGRARGAVPGALGAVHWVSRAELAAFVPGWSEGSDPLRRAMALRARRLHGSVPPGLRRDLAHPDPVARREAMELAAVRSPDVFREHLPDLLADADAPTRLAAAERAGAAGWRGLAIGTLAALAEGADEAAGLARDWAAMAMTCEEIADWIRRSRDRPALAARLVGLAGEARYWPWLIERMEEPGTALAAGLAARDLAARDLPPAAFDHAEGLAPALAGLDPDAADIPRADWFRAALAAGTLIRPGDPERLSARAWRLEAMRARAAGWADTPSGARACGR